MPYDKQVWRDGKAGNTPLQDERLNHVEAGLLGVADTLDALVDAVNALIAGKAATAIEKIAGGTTAGRPSPLLDTVYRDHDLGRVLYGTGSAWVSPLGVAITGSGAANAPQAFVATVNPDNSITLSWRAVAGASYYKLYEVQSPGGVTGASALATTTDTRTPGTLRTYEYWVTAWVGGIESAASNHASATLPYAAPTGQGSPAALLKFGTTGGLWTLGVGYPTGYLEYPYATLSTGATYPPYYVLNAAGTAVQFQVPMNGARPDSSTSYEWCELREMNNDGITRAAWTATSGTHSMEYSFKVDHLQPLRPQVVIGRLCASTGDVATVRVTGVSTSALDVVAAIGGVDQATKLITGYTIGSTAKIKFDIANATLNFYANDVLKISSTTALAAGGGGGGTPWTAQLYVATTGNDSNAGTLKSAPKRTILAALSAANAGDTISVANGTYSGNLQSTKGGSAAGGFITIRAENKWGAKLLGNGSTEEQSVFEMNHPYLRLQDLEITGPGAENVGARNGVLASADNLQVVNCWIHDCCLWLTDGTGWQGGAAIQSNHSPAANWLFDGNLIHDIGLRTSSQELVHGMYIGNSGTNLRAVNNIIHSCEDFGLHPYGSSGAWEFINNTIFNCGRGILQEGSGHKTRNNYVYNCRHGPHYDIRGSGFTGSNNMYGGTGDGIAGASFATQQNSPLFVRYATDGSADLHPQTGSPLINAGTSTDAPPRDYAGTARPQGGAVDVGAYEVVTAASGGGTAASGYYYRLGAYPQSSSTAGGFESPSEYCQIELSGLTVAHNPPLGVTVADGVEAAKLLGWGAVIDGDEFDYTGPPSVLKWSMYDGPGHDGNGIRSPSAFNVANGILTCTGDNVSGGTTGGMAFQRSEMYCRIEWRVRAYPITPGSSGNKYHPVLIEWPTDDVWPQHGEYDFYECDIDSGKYEAYLHIPGNDGSAQEYVSKTCDISQWHNIAFEWSSTGIKGWLDGVQVFAYSGSYILAPTNMQPTFQLDNFFGSNMQPARFEAMWFRVYNRPA